MMTNNTSISTTPALASPEVANSDAPTLQGKQFLKMRKYPMGGFVRWNMPYREQRQDQGQDFEIPIGHTLIAPGHGVCTNHLHDGAFPNGFGSPYAVIRLDSGPFKGLELYLGHGNVDVIPIGHHFHTGDPLVRLTNSLNRGWGWVEVGVCANGLPQGNGTGARYHHLFKPVWHWG